MKIANYEKMQLGDLVQVPRTQFAPMRRGWNGWLFSEAVVLRKTRGKKSNRPIIPARRTCSRYGRPAAEDGRQIAVSVYCGKIAAVIPAIEYVAGQQVFKQLF